MYHLSSGKQPGILRLVAVCWAVPLALCGLVLAGCSSNSEPANQAGQTSQQGSSTSEGGEDSGRGTEDTHTGSQNDGEVKAGGVAVGTKIPAGFPDDMPLPQKAPTSVVTIGQGGGTVGGGWALNYDGVSMDEVEHVLQQAEAAGYQLNGPFNNGSSKQWGLKKDKTAVLVAFSEGANLNITLTALP